MKLRDIIDAIKVGWRAALDHWHTMRWLRSGGCPDDLPASF